MGVVWIFAGFFTILILAGADKIPTDMFDAACIEGATNRQMFRLITIPMIWDVIVITLVLWVIEAIKMMEYPYAFGGPNIDQNLYTPAIYLFIMGFGQRQPVYQLGYATAIGVAMFMFTIIAVSIVGLVPDANKWSSRCAAEPRLSGPSRRRSPISSSELGAPFSVFLVLWVMMASLKSTRSLFG